jgi:hypothetical protein
MVTVASDFLSMLNGKWSSQKFQDEQINEKFGVAFSDGTFKTLRRRFIHTYDNTCVTTSVVDVTIYFPLPTMYDVLLQTCLGVF